MKRIFFFAVAGLMVAAIGCKSGASGSDPKTTLLDFFHALSKKDLKTARQYATKESEGMFTMMEMGLQMAQKLKGKDVDDAFDKFNQDRFEIGEPKIDGDKAIVPVTMKKDNETANFTLKKEDGSWKVAFDMATMMEMGREKMHEKGMDISADSANNILDSIRNVNVDSLKETMRRGMSKLDSLRKGQH